MTRHDLIAFETHQAATYRREAKKRGRNPKLAARLNELADASAARAEEFRSGPLFRGKE
jgi:hypothetical protein